MSEKIETTSDGTIVLTRQSSSVVADNSLVKDLIIENLAAAIEVVSIDKKTVNVTVWLHEGGQWNINKSYRLKIHEKALIQARQTGFRPHEPSIPAIHGNKEDKASLSAV